MDDLQLILSDLAVLPGWEERYEYIIDLGRQLPPFPPAQMTEANLVRGCTSTVYMTIGWNKGMLELGLTSDALIVNGLLALVYAAYHGQTKRDAQVVNLPMLLERTALLEHLSPNRRHGFASVMERVFKFIA
ncbi:MAG TPA: SufE family protein [Alphaproteobacteria bacterium]|nr:SufE family protein [Alphaproteobacteria bacterium]